MADATKIGVADATKMGVANARVANATQPFIVVHPDYNNIRLGGSSKCITILHGGCLPNLLQH